MFRPESPRSRFGKPNFILGWIASVDSEISIIDLLGVDCRKRREKESKQKRTNPVHKIYTRDFDNYAFNRDISWMQSRTALFRIGYTSHIASYTDRGLDNFGWAEHPADLAEIAPPQDARTKEFEPRKALETAVNVFWRFGYEHTSPDVLMREMGIARQSLYELATNGPCTCGR